MKQISFLGDSLARLRDFPDDARSEAGHQLNEVQIGNDPDDWKPMKTIGPGVREIRIREQSGAFRVIYLATLPEAVLVLHAFQMGRIQSWASYSERVKASWTSSPGSRC